MYLQELTVKDSLRLVPSRKNSETPTKSILPAALIIASIRAYCFQPSAGYLSVPSHPIADPHFVISTHD